MKHIAIVASCLSLLVLPACIGTPEPVADAATGCTRLRMLGMDRAVWLRTDTLAGFGRVRSPSSAIQNVSIKLPSGYQANGYIPQLLMESTDEAQAPITCTSWHHFPSTWCSERLPGTELRLFIDYRQGEPETVEADAKQLAEYVEHEVICRPSS